MCGKPQTYSQGLPRAGAGRPEIASSDVRFDAYWGGPAKIPAMHYTNLTRTGACALMVDLGDAALVEMRVHISFR